MTKKIITMTALGAVLASTAAFAYKGSNLAKDAKISMSEAEKIALGAVHGKIEDKELEKEKGKLIYSFEIKKGKIEHEVTVDANSGKIIENKIEKEDKDKE